MAKLDEINNYIDNATAETPASTPAKDLSKVFQKRITVTNEDVDQLMSLFARFNSTTLWSKVKRNDFTVRRFELGYVANTCCCELTADAMKRFGVSEAAAANADDDCTAIVVKYRNPNFIKFMNATDDSWIDVNTILVATAQKGITPRLVYVDRHCSVQQYIPSRVYTNYDDNDPSTVKQLARLLAQIHCFRLPLSNDSCSIWKIFELSEKNFLNNTYESNYLQTLERDTKERKDKYYDKLANINLKESFLFAMNLAKKVNSPVMMTQGDFNPTNRLVREKLTQTDNSNNNGIDHNEISNKEKKIFLVDFDNSGYTYRGIDFGAYYSNYNNTNNDVLFGTGQFPTDEQLEMFFIEYRTECIKEWGEEKFTGDTRNTLQHLLLEAKVFTLANYMFMLSFALKMYKLGDVKADYFLNGATNSYQGFLTLKERFTTDGTIELILKQK